MGGGCKTKVASKVRSIKGGINFLGKMRIRAELSQEVVEGRMGYEKTFASKIERKPDAYFRGRRQLIIDWADICKVPPTDRELQRFLAETGNAYWIPNDEAAEAMHAVAAALALGPDQPPTSIDGRQAALAIARRLIEHSRNKPPGSAPASH